MDHSRSAVAGEAGARCRVSSPLTALAPSCATSNIRLLPAAPSPCWAPSSERQFTRLANDDHNFSGVAVELAQRAVSHQAYKAARSRPFGFAVTTRSASLVHVSMGAPS